MKRLKHYFNKMNEKTMTYVEIYDGKVIVHSSLPEYEDYMPEYYHDDIMLRITTTHKLAQDRPVYSDPSAWHKYLYECSSRFLPERVYKVY